MKNKILKDEEIYILDNSNMNIEVLGKTSIFIPNIKNINITINMSDNSEADIYIYTECESNNKIIVNQNNSTKLNIYHGFWITEKYDLNLETNITGSNNTSNVYIRGIVTDKINLNLDGKIHDDTNENEMLESIQILTRGGKVEVSPMLHVNSKNCLASHGNSISNINEEELFYLMAKGIKRDIAIKLIEDSYKYGLFKNCEDFKKYLNI